MKKLLLASLVLASVATNAQTKKVILEDFTGGWCGWCPEGTVILEGLEVSNPTNFIPIATHQGDALEIPDGTAIISALNQSSYPGGAVDRKLFSGEAKVPVGRGKWSGYVANRLATSAIVSVGFANQKQLADGTYEADVNVKFTSAPAAGTPLRLYVYILEDSIRATASSSTMQQDNYSSNVKGGQSPLDPWYYNHTLRKSLGSATGYSDAIPATPVVNTTYTKKISFSLPSGTPPTGWVAKQIHLVAFVAYNGAAASDKQEVLNAEETKLSSFFKVGVNNVTANTSINSVYPNPAIATSVVKVEYNLTENANTTIKVFNAMGQLVATPASSDNEVAGTHTLAFRPSEHNMVPGTYFVQVVSSNGASKTESIVIQ